MNENELIDRVAALRAVGHSPKDIARALGVRPAVVAPLIRAVAVRAAAASPEPALLGCWVNGGWSKDLLVEGDPDWPAGHPGTADPSGLVGVLVARGHRRRDRASVCGYLVDVFCLGVKDALGPRVMPRAELPGLVRRFFGVWEAPPLEAPIGLAQDLVLGAVEFACALGLEPAPDLEPARGHLGPWQGPSRIRFGRRGTPLFVQGPWDDSERIMSTLERSVGRGGFEYILSLEVRDASRVVGGRTRRGAVAR